MWKQFAAIGAVGGAAVAASQYINDSTATPYHERYSRDTQSGNILKAIGNTPLIELESLSKATGRRILAKAEYMNPGGSVKDRAALWLIEAAEREGRLTPGTGQTVVEGTGGNTGIGLALVCAAKGYKAKFSMPESIAVEKINMMKTLGAEVILTPPVPFTDPKHYFHVAHKLEAEDPANVVCVGQFENLANAQSHYESTGPEVWKQAGGKVDGFICAAGTGGTIGGMSKYLKEKSKDKCVVYLADPHGSGLFDAVHAHLKGEKVGVDGTDVHGEPIVWFPRSAGGSITEGIGTDRKTKNFGTSLDAGYIDGTLQVTDQEAIDMGYHVLQNDGVFIGPSAALNVVAAVKLAAKLEPGSTVVTILCDGGDRYMSKMYDEAWLKEKKLTPAPLDLGKLAAQA